MSRRARSSSRTPTGKAWLQDYKAVSKWLGQYDLLALLDQHGGLCQIKNFLPAHVAEYAFELMGQVPVDAWNPTGANEDYSHNNIEHMFWSSKHTGPLQDLLRVFSILLPDKLNSFSAARYDASHHIAPHDDRAYTDVMMEDGQVVECSRQVAVIYYLTKGWRPDWGGHLLDLEGGTTVVPEFNSAIAFTVPRYHQVTPVTGPNPRYSVFGWFLEPGHLYDLFTGEDEQQRRQQQQQQHAGSNGRLTSLVGHDAGSTAVADSEENRRRQQQQAGRDQAAGSSAEDEGAAGASACDESETRHQHLSAKDGGKRRKDQQSAQRVPDKGSAGLPEATAPCGSADDGALKGRGHSAPNDGSGVRKGGRDAGRCEVGERGMVFPVSRRGILKLVNKI